MWIYYCASDCRNQTTDETAREGCVGRNSGTMRYGLAGQLAVSIGQ